jgi:hypothetical protein
MLTTLPSPSQKPVPCLLALICSFFLAPSETAPYVPVFSQN